LIRHFHAFHFSSSFFFFYTRSFGPTKFGSVLCVHWLITSDCMSCVVEKKKQLSHRFTCNKHWPHLNHWHWKLKKNPERDQIRPILMWLAVFETKSTLIHLYNVFFDCYCCQNFLHGIVAFWSIPARQWRTTSTPPVGLRAITLKTIRNIIVYRLRTIHLTHFNIFSFWLIIW
jgi:hypothetical protein